VFSEANGNYSKLCFTTVSAQVNRYLAFKPTPRNRTPRTRQLHEITRDRTVQTLYMWIDFNRFNKCARVYGKKSKS